ncbi:MAG TPA: rod shape-determining protein MreD [Bryobacterales bacterium]|nr:rod shape-determining protein MreD [Bryobacterales bacterium]
MEASVKRLIEADINRLRPWIAVAAVVVALLLQAYLPLLPFLSSYANMADLPLLVTIYLALLRRSPVAGLAIGLAVGLGQDSLSAGPIGIYGILKTIIGYICSSLTLIIAVDSLAARVFLVWCFYLLHQAMFWVMQRVLLGQPADFAWQRMLLLAAINALIALVIYRFLDRFREST